MGDDRAPSKRASRGKQRAAAILLALFVGLGIAEAALRASGRGPIPVERPSLLVYFWVRDARLGFRDRKDGDFADARTGSRVRTGRFGERLGAGWKGDVARPAVLFVGDSTTFCAEVEDDETYPSEVAKRLPDSLGVSCVNLGVPGYNTVQSLRMAEEWLDRVPTRLVVYTYCDNDYIENVVPMIQKPAWAPVAAVTSREGFHLIEVPGEAGPWGEPVGVDPPLTFLDRFADRSALGALTKRLATRLDAAPWLDSFDEVERKHHGTEILEDLLVLLRDLCAKHGASLLVTRFTTGRLSLVEGGRFRNTHEKLERACREANVRYVDLMDAFTRPPDDYRAHFKGGVVDAHHNHLGTSTMGEALAPHVRGVLGGH